MSCVCSLKSFSMQGLFLWDDGVYQVDVRAALASESVLCKVIFVPTT